MDYAAPLDLLSALLFGVAMIYLIRAKSPLLDRPSWVFLLLSLGIYFVVGVFNVLEHGGITDYLDRFEDYLEIIFITFFLFFIYSVNINIDLMRRHRVERDLIESERQYRTLVEAIPYGIQEMDIDGTITFSNTAHCRMHGYNVPELIGRTIYDFSPTAEHRQNLQEYIRYLVTDQPAPTPWISRDRKRDGSLMDVRVDWDYKRDSSGAVTGFISLVSDITESRKAEEDIKLFHSLLQRSNDAIYVIDPNTAGIIEVNAKSSRVLGYSRDELLHLKITDIDTTIPVDTQWTEYVEDLRRRGSVLYDCEHRRKDGILFAVEVNMSFIDLGERGYLLAIVRDISERKKIEEERLKAQKLESLGILAGGLAHDFNNLLTAILGNISILKMELISDETAIERLGEAEKASLRAKDLTRQLITFARGGEPVKKITSIDKIIREAVKFSLSGSAVICDFKLSDEIWPVKADEGQISQVMNNLLINAVQAMSGGGTIHIECKNVTGVDGPVRNSDRGRFVRVSVRDNGVGIPRDYLPHIFDPYYTTKQTGSGLGLATVYSIIKRHDGEITVDSKAGKGSVFTFYLPAAIREGVEANGLTAEAVLGKGRILVMDDERQVLEVLRRMLQILGYAVETVPEGNSAVELFREAREVGKSYDAVILDLTVPGGMGGEETLKRLLQIDPGVKAIVSSGYSNDPILSDYKSFGFSGVVVKPFTIEEVSEVLHEILSRTPGHRSS